MPERFTASRFPKDLISLRDEKIDGEPLLKAVMKDGERLHPPQSLDAMHECFQQDFKAFSDSVKAIENPDPYLVEFAPGLQKLQKKHCPCGDRERAG